MVRPRWMAGVSDVACGLFCRSMPACVGDLSLRPQPIGWSASRVSLLLNDKTRDRADQFRPTGVVSTRQKWAPLCVGGIAGREAGYDEDQCKGVGLHRSVMPLLLATLEAAE